MSIRKLALILSLLILPLAAQEPSSRPTNRLAKEKSPYLRQHAHNPVDWWPWCDEAFAEAKRRGVPIFLSIGYSTCHWCHVMERESFENEEVAAVLNAAFVCIKLDREERPDIDAVYMKVIQSLNGRGGWPATILLLPDRRPFWAATYLPAETVKELAAQISKKWQGDRADIEEKAGKLLDHLKRLETRIEAKDLPPAVLEDQAVAALVRRFDEKNGGFGAAPKFPRVPGLLFLLRAADERALGMAWETMKSIAHGGIHDHLGGGVHRYTVDAGWRVPHFEKMLYDQAMALEACVDLGRSCAEPRADGMAEDIVNCLLRDFRAPGGGFYSAFDADSDGQEGAFYVWTRAEIEELLEGDELRVVLDRFDIREEGNQDELHGLEKANILIVAHTFAETAESLEMGVAEVTTLWRSARDRLLARRKTRVPPHRDDKIITAWNGLAISALARAGRALDRPGWLSAAEAAADFIDRKLRNEEGLLLRRFIDGEAGEPTTLQDHAYLAMGLLDLFEATGDPRRLEAARREALQIKSYHDPEIGAFLDSLEKNDLVFATRNAFDGAMPSANGMATLVMLRFHALEGESHWLELADSALKIFGAEMGAFPVGYPVLLRALKMRLEGSRQVILVGDPQHEDTKAMAADLRRRHLPDTLVLFLSPAQAKALGKTLPVVAGKSAGPGGAPRVYVCRDRSCLAPLADLRALREAFSEEKDED